MSSFVYLIQGENGGPIKIGLARSPERRLRAFQAGCPVRLRLLRVIEGDIVDELWLQKRFASQRLHGEWFAESTDLHEFAHGTAPIGAAIWKIRRARLDAGLSRQQFAQLFDLSISSVIRLDRSEPRRLSVRRVRAIAQATGKPLSFFLEEAAA
jgi:hypothetical protein